MRPEDKYTAGLGAGVLTAAAGAGGIAAGNRMRRGGRESVRRNRGGRGDQVRGQRLKNAAREQAREGKEGLGKFRRVDTKAGVRYMDGNKFARTTPYKQLIEDAKTNGENGSKMYSRGSGKRTRSAAGLKAMKRGRFVRMGGVAGLAAGLGVAAGSVAAGERYQSKRSRQRDKALKPPKEAEWKDTRTVSQLRPKRAPEGKRKIAEDKETGKFSVAQTRAQDEWDKAWKDQFDKPQPHLYAGDKRYAGPKMYSGGGY